MPTFSFVSFAQTLLYQYRLLKKVDNPPKADVIIIESMPRSCPNPEGVTEFDCGETLAHIAEK